MTAPVWVQRRAEEHAAYLAARIDWSRHRHHCWDPLGGPMPADLDDLLTQVMDKWNEAGKLRDEAAEAEAHAQNLRYMAEDKLDEADELAKPLIEAHPEWRDALNEQRDPRA